MEDAEKPKGRLKLREPLAGDLLDFRAANYQAPEIEIVHEALREHIDRRLNEPEMRKRFEAAKKARLGQPQPSNIRIVRPNED